MKKLLLLLTALLLMLSMAACQAPADDKEGSALTPSEDSSENTDKEDSTANDTDKTDTESAEAFSFTLGDVKLKPGQAFDSAALPEADSVYEVPSCAIEGTDLVYNYTTVEVTAYDDGSGPVIYCIFIADPDTSTDEGLRLGDTKQQAEALYGTDYKEEFGQLIYTREKTQLILIMENDAVISIEYRMVTE